MLAISPCYHADPTEAWCSTRSSLPPHWLLSSLSSATWDTPWAARTGAIFLMYSWMLFASSSASLFSLLCSGHSVVFLVSESILLSQPKKMDTVAKCTKRIRTSVIVNTRIYCRAAENCTSLSANYTIKYIKCMIGIIKSWLHVSSSTSPLPLLASLATVAFPCVPSQLLPFGAALTSPLTRCDAGCSLPEATHT